MELLKRHWFWLVTGGILLACGAYYALGVWGDRTANAGIQTQLEEQNQVLQGWVSSPRNIPPKGQAEEYLRYAATLGSELAQCQAMLKAPERWRNGWLDRPVEECAQDYFKAAYQDKVRWLVAEDPAVPGKPLHLRFLATRRSFVLADYSGLPTRDQMALDSKRLMLQLDLVGVLHNSQVLRLPEGGIRFDGDTGDALADFPSSPKKAAKADPRRTVHPFVLTADLKLQDLPLLLDNLLSSSFNYAFTGLMVKKLESESDRENLILLGLLPPERRDEVVRVTLSCEASEYLFGEKKP